MGIKEEPFVESQSVSVEDPYSFTDPNVFVLSLGVSEVVLSVDVYVKQPQKTQVTLDSMVQIAVPGIGGGSPDMFGLTYEIQQNGTTIATINDEMDFVSVRRHINFPNFPVLDNNPNIGINTYDLVCTSTADATIIIASRSLKATVFPV
ncbi:hypothetical protein [Chengkuizengella sediminis]|uniref:hypothetical protein n=1 Tax=Chengkuizengella sediminis TaxID=1885917 RepID=UPI00138992FE|nr:hypothetical protein [Chengkuizengella sediminis]NDI34531.1 hypothetical protein [Chengkuizengella sediminis]